MITYFKMKKREWKVKAAFYGMIISIVDNQKELIEFVQKLFLSLKDISVEDMRDEFISKLAEIIHTENKDNSET